MADAKKCDRCGDFYIPTPYSSQIEDGLKITQTYINNKTYTTHLDLCDECIKEFHSWFDNVIRPERRQIDNVAAIDVLKGV